MAKSLQKTAKRLRNVELPHPGILSRDFYDNYELRCYEPSADLRPFVVHVWTQRKKADVTATQPLEVQTGPNIYLFSCEAKTFIQGVCSGSFKYDPTLLDVYAGIKFRPGGFRAFLDCSVAELTERVVSAENIFPGIESEFDTKLSSMTDRAIVAALEDTLRRQMPVVDKNLQRVTEIMELLQNNPMIESVQDVVHAVGKSERSLQVLFREYVGVSLKWVLVRRRLLAALAHASLSGLTWAEIAANLGYSSQSHFTREFKHVTGISPSAYRKLQKIPDLV